MSDIVCWRCGAYIGLIMFMGHFTAEQMNRVKIVCPKCIEKQLQEDEEIRRNIEKLK